MKKKLLLTSLALFAVAGNWSPRAAADYPIVSQRYLADPSALVVGDRVYVYCSNDDENPTGDEAKGIKGDYKIPNVVCVSTTDMKNWTDHGIVFDAARDTKWGNKSWAPAAIERNGKFYLYYGNGGNGIGVVVSSSPTGPFTDPIGGKLITGDTPGVKPAEHMWLFDPAVFIDDDGQAYLYFGGNGDDNVRIAKLKPDMVSVDGEIIKMSAPNFYEASWMHKRNGIYYFSYSTTPKAQMRIDYMTSDKPTSGFTYRGVIGGQPPLNNNNNHASEFEFKGQWYHIFHNRIVAKEAGIPSGFRRNLALERFSYNPDGSIESVKYAPDDVPQIGSLNPYVRVEAETTNAQKGIKTEPCKEGGMDVTSIQNGDWIKVYGVDFGADGARSFSARAASATQGSKIELHLGASDGKLIGTCEVHNTGGDQSWKVASCPVSGAMGKQNLFLVFTGGSGDLMNVDSWQFSK